MIVVIGLTGKSGSGKSFLCQIAKEFNIDNIDTDAVYHKLLIPPSDCLKEICENFNYNILNSDGTLNRPALANIVFGDHPDAKNNLKRLNKITHKYILDKTRKIILKSKSKAILIDAPALFESGFDKECNFVISVIADDSLRCKRVICRDKITEEQANERIFSQNCDDFYTTNSKYTILNNGDKNTLRKEFEKILKLENLT